MVLLVAPRREGVLRGTCPQVAAQRRGQTARINVTVEEFVPAVGSRHTPRKVSAINRLAEVR